MALQEAQPPPDLAQLLNDHERRGGVLGFSFFRHDTRHPSESELHRETAVAALRVFEERNEQHFAHEGVIQAFKDAGLDYDSHFRVVTQPEKAMGWEVSIADFFGPLYDVASRRLLLRGRTRDHLNHYFFVEDEERRDTIRQVPPYASEGYSYAFTEPPYGLQGTSEEINALFLGLNALLFNDFAAEHVIYRWSTDWSTYFDAGQEWWGAFLWTVHNTETDLVIGIGASTTD